ncbi:VOC family protein [Paraburkholderia bannensis]|uniref:VOC family protein n=1 Tax=Paraburkholderia bannensis TaxID=765414 RepID=UPI002AB6D555|nr:VOC family protein [Paraburkholderia bannensis]
MSTEILEAPQQSATSQPARVISWFEIPAHDLDRAARFYESAFDTVLQREVVGGVPMAIFGHTDTETGGCIVFNPHEAKPDPKGVLVYLNAQPSVTAVLDRVERAGGKRQGPALELPNNYGYIGFFIDTEGNRVGLHAAKLG